MTRAAEVESAYFTLLRAREEFDLLHRYAIYLDAELRRVDDFVKHVREGPDDVPVRFRRPVEGTTRQLLDAVGVRRAAILDERAKLPSRIEAAEAFVRECEAEHERLRELRP